MVRKLAFSIILLGVITVYAVAGDDYKYNEYNHRIARISYIQNNLSFAHGDEEWTAASINMPLQPGDRVFAPPQSRAEIQFDDGSSLRIGGNTEVTLTRLDDDHIQIRLSVGLATLRVYSSLYFELNTPSAAITAEEKGTYRIEVQENGGVDVKVRKGRATVYNQALEKHVRKGEHIVIFNRDGADFEVAQLGSKDEWDQWNERRDAVQGSRASGRYLPDSAYMGAFDLDGYGRWVSVGGYGDCWVPSVATSWSPYRVGRWVYRPFWGWTWVSYEPWGWLPYHYGRWFYSAPYGWAWYPGARHGFYFWSPGLVRFSYGSDWVGWCPLGPRDYVSFNLFFGRSYYRSYAVNLNFGFGGGGYGYDNLYNHRAPNSIVYVNHNTFINNSVTNVYNTYNNSRRVTYNTMSLPANAFAGGTIVRDHQLPFKPTTASFSPNPTGTVRAPRPEFVNRPVFVNNNNARPTGRGVRAQDPASGGLSLRPETSKGATATRGTPAPAAQGNNPFVRSTESRSGGRDVRPLSPAETSKGVQGGAPNPTRPGTNDPFVRSSSPRPSDRVVTPNAPSSNPTPAVKPSRSDWPTAPSRSVERPSPSPVQGRNNPTLQPSSPAPARSIDRPSSSPSNPAPAARPSRSDWPTAPSRSVERPSAPPSSPASRSIERPSPPPPARNDRPNMTLAPSREERHQKPAGRENSSFNSPTSNRDFVQAPRRSSNDGGGVWRRSEPAISRDSASHSSPPPAREYGGPSSGGSHRGFEGYARGREAGPSASPAPRYNPPPMHSSAPPARSAPSYNPPASYSSPAPSQGGMGRSMGSPSGGHIESGGRGGERHSRNQH